MSLIFDTLRHANRMTKVGFTTQQAEEQAAAMAELVNENVANKQDLKQSTKEIELKIEQVRAELKCDIEKLDLKIEQVRSELKGDIEKLDLKIEQVRSELKRDLKELDLKIEQFRSELKHDIEAIKNELLIKLGGMIVSSLGVLVILMKLFKL